MFPPQRVLSSTEDFQRWTSSRKCLLQIQDDSTCEQCVSSNRELWRHGVNYQTLLLCHCNIFWRDEEVQQKASGGWVITLDWAKWLIFTCMFTHWKKDVHGPLKSSNNSSHTENVDLDRISTTEEYSKNLAKSDPLIQFFWRISSFKS